MRHQRPDISYESEAHRMASSGLRNLPEGVKTTGQLVGMDYALISESRGQRLVDNLKTQQRNSPLPTAPSEH
ncbi:MAG: hypothetical protein AB7I08_06740 [Thermoleophilia bacterium]